MRQQQKPKMGMILKTWKDGVIVRSAKTTKLGRFSRLVQAEQFSEPNTEVYIRVNYGKQIDSNDELTPFINEGTYTSRDRLMVAYQAFLEVGR